MDPRPPGPSGRHRGFVPLIAALVVATAAAGAWQLGMFRSSGEDGPVEEPDGAAGDPGGVRALPTTSSPSPSPSPTPAPGPRPINRSFQGLTTFRGNATRTYYGEGPVPSDPAVLWRHPSSGGLCSESSDQKGARVWCGTGWTGQPNVVVTDDGVEVRFGAYDRGVHVLDAMTGEPLKDTFPTGDLIKGTVTTDPGGYPLLYVGSRDNYLRILATDRGRELVELWKLSSDSAPNPMWNNDWDGSPLVIGDYLLEGGENSWFYVVKLNRGYDGGKVTVAPEIVGLVPGYDDELLAAVGSQVSIESSVAYHKGIVYFGNSGGLVQGWNVRRTIRGRGEPLRTFRFWMGDDTDATVVVDQQGFVYAAAELEAGRARSAEVGQLVKLDPRKPDDPVVWSIPVPGQGGDGGIWATPALYGEDALFVPTNTGRLLAVDRDNGRIAWEIDLPPPTWSSPAVVDDVLVIGDCAGYLHAYDVAHPLRGVPDELWSIQLDGCIESTPAVWKGAIYVGTRGGGVYALADPER